MMRLVLGALASVVLVSGCDCAVASRADAGGDARLTDARAADVPIADARIDAPTVDAGPPPLTRIAAKRFHTCAWRPGAAAFCWGRNERGELGDGSTVDRLTPVAVTVVSEVIEMAAGGTSSGGGHTCAVLPDQSVRCWGRNGEGQLGDGTRDDRAVAVAPAGLDDVVDVSAGNLHTCALHASGAISCWGFNRDGQIGDGTRADRLAPVEVSGIDDAVQVSAGSFHNCALMAGGNARCWGHPGYGQLGNGSIMGSFTPVPEDVLAIDDAVEISSNGFSSCARRPGGEVLCWGGNEYAALGDGTLVDRSSPVPVVGLTSAVELADGHCARLVDATAVCWGSGVVGQNGDGTWDIIPMPVPVLGLSGVVHVSGYSPTCAVLADARVMCWGPNENGQVGDGTTENRNTPVEVAGLAW